MVPTYYFKCEIGNWIEVHHKEVQRRESHNLNCFWKYVIRMETFMNCSSGQNILNEVKNWKKIGEDYGTLICSFLYFLISVVKVLL